VSLRRATAEDAAVCARIHRDVMRTSLSFLPELHTAEEDFRYFSEKLFPFNAVWVVEEAGEVVGYIAFQPHFVEHLYILPEHQDRGLGARLLEKAMAGARELRLWTFQANAKARRFYERHGFTAERLTDGADNEEKQPDVLYHWVRPEPVTAAPPETYSTP
jgi:putative acetyltransferase